MAEYQNNDADTGAGQYDPLASIHKQLDEVEARTANETAGSGSSDPGLNPIDQITQRVMVHADLVDNAMAELRTEFPDANEAWLTEAKTIMRGMTVESLQTAIKGGLHKKHVLQYVGEQAHATKKAEQLKTPPPTTPIGAGASGTVLADQLKADYARRFGKEPSADALAWMVKEREAMRR